MIHLDVISTNLMLHMHESERGIDSSDIPGYVHLLKVYFFRAFVWPIVYFLVYTLSLYFCLFSRLMLELRQCQILKK